MEELTKEEIQVLMELLEHASGVILSKEAEMIRVIYYKLKRELEDG